MLYLTVIFMAMLIIVVANALCAAGSIPALTLSTVLGTVSVIAWDGIQALLIRRALPERLFAPDSAAFRVGKRERAFYRKLNVNRWKHLVPELGCFTGFHKREFSSPSDPAYLGRFLVESNYGVVIHVLNAVLGPLILLLPWCSSPSIGLPIALVNLVLSLLPVAILRFNTAPLRSIYLHHKK